MADGVCDELHKMSTQIVELNPSASKLFGRYNRGDIILVLCDAAAAPFDVVLPDPRSLEDTLLIIKKVDSTDNAVSIRPALPTQTIDGSAALSIEVQYKAYTLAPHSRTNQYLITAQT